MHEHTLILFTHLMIELITSGNSPASHHRETPLHLQTRPTTLSRRAHYKRDLTAILDLYNRTVDLHRLVLNILSIHARLRTITQHRLCFAILALLCVIFVTRVNATTAHNEHEQHEYDGDQAPTGGCGGKIVRVQSPVNLNNIFFLAEKIRLKQGKKIPTLQHQQNGREKPNHTETIFDAAATHADRGQKEQSEKDASHQRRCSREKEKLVLFQRV